MPLTASDITIAITVYDRREFLEQSISSALSQTVPVRVIVVEDRGPDETLQNFVKEKFGSRVEYFRNPKRLGLFGNFNRCLELCSTKYVCILHDDDFLMPTFGEAMVELSQLAPDRGFYYGMCNVVDEIGAPLQTFFEPTRGSHSEMDAIRAAMQNPVAFPAQLICVQAAKELDGFRTTSKFCADWELWLKLALHSGAAMTNRVIATVRDHATAGRGTARVIRSGKVYALTNAQRKQNIAILRERGILVKFDRIAIQKFSPLPLHFLLSHGKNFSQRLLRYNVALCLLSSAPNAAYKLLQAGIRFFGPNFAGLLSKIWNVFHSSSRPG